MTTPNTASAADTLKTFSMAVVVQTLSFAAPDMATAELMYDAWHNGDECPICAEPMTECQHFIDNDETVDHLTEQIGN